MFPFHRHHSNSSSSSHSHKLKGNGRSRDRGHRDEEEDEDYYQSTNSRFSKAQTHSQLQQSRWDYVLGETNATTRSREPVLACSIPQTSARTDKYSDNKFRLGTNRLTNVFSSLQNLKVENQEENQTQTHRSTNSVVNATRNDDPQSRLTKNIRSEFKTTAVASSSCKEAEVVIEIGSKEGLEVEESNNDKVPKTLSDDNQDVRVSLETNQWAVDVKSSKQDDISIPKHNDGLIVVEEVNDDDDRLKDEIKKEELDISCEENGLELVERKVGDGEVKSGTVEIEDHDEKDENDNAANEVDGNAVRDDDEEDGKEDGKEIEVAPGEVDAGKQDNATGKIYHINEQTAILLKEVLLDTAKSLFSSQWMEQGFTFDTNHRLRYGFVQTKGGPCGVLATVQSVLLKILLFEANTCSCTQPLRPTGSEARAALIAAVTEVLWRAAADEQKASLVVRSSSSRDKVLKNSALYRCDGVTETLSVATYNSRTSLQEGVRQHLEQLITPGESGCLLLVLSAVLSRGLDRVRLDMDEPTPLIGPNGRCSMELVNLLLIGRAVSNVFDNNIKTGACVIKGIHRRSEIGFLTLFEHYNACQVGSYLKTPRHPIWLVFYDNHYTVLFSSRKELISDWRAEKQFKLIHYDSLARQKDEVQLTVDTTGLHLKERAEGTSIPPLELCIRTKWKAARVHWNDSTATP